MCSSKYAMTGGMSQCKWLDCTASDSVVESFPVGQTLKSSARIDYPKCLEFSENLLKMKQNHFLKELFPFTYRNDNRLEMISIQIPNELRIRRVIEYPDF